MNLEVKKIIMTLTSSRDETTQLNALQKLENIKMTTNILKETKCGITINNIRKNSRNPKVQEKCKKLLVVWKTLVASKPTEKSKEEEKTPKAQTTREKCITLIAKAFLPDDHRELATRIEECIANVHSPESREYKAEIRSRYANIKSNNELRDNLITGELFVEDFCRMTTAEMATSKQRRADEKTIKENLEKKRPFTAEATTDQFKCGKCKQRKCTYYQLQTRSADEPMTVFVTCVSCGNKWKF